MNTLMKKFKQFEIGNQSIIKAGAIVITRVGGDGDGNSLFDAVDNQTGEEFCSVNDYDLTYNVGDVIG